jgi:protein-disulfide isomerase
MISIRTFLLIFAMTAAALAQQPEILVTSTLKTFTTADLSVEARNAWLQRDRALANAREQLLTQMVTETVLDLEAKAVGSTPAKIVSQIRSKIPDPTDADIQSTYDANRAALENRPLSEVRMAVVRFLRRDPEDRALKSYVEELAGKYRISYQNDINSPSLKPTDVLFTVGGQAVTSQNFENKYRLTLYEVKAQLIDDINDELDGTVLGSLVDAEAALLKIDQQAYIAREITNKLRQFSDDEKAKLETGLRNRLYTKYKVKFLLKTPPPVVQRVSVDDDPARGPVGAPVTIVMFGDFQCPSCARTHPILQKVIAEFPGKIRFVARDYPLENLHENAFHAALAAYAAMAQGKFWEYGEILYRNQERLDDDSLKKYAAQLGLNVPKFQLDFTSERAAAEVRKDMADAIAYGVTGTPTIFVNGVMVRHLTEEAIREAIQNALKTATSAAARSARK